jgi:hypothetical protein
MTAVGGVLKQTSTTPYTKYFAPAWSTIKVVRERRHMHGCSDAIYEANNRVTQDVREVLGFINFEAYNRAL